MVQDVLTKEILGILKPSHNNWSETLKAKQLDGIYAVMVGAVVGVMQCRGLLEQWGVSANRHLYDLDTLYADVQESIGPGGSVRWNHGANFLDWSTGYFLNRAEHNICSAFDRILSAWIGCRAKWDMSKENSEDIWFASWPSNRSKILNVILSIKGNRSEELDEVTDAFGSQNLADTKTASKELKYLARGLSTVRKSPLIQFYNSLTKHGAPCLALVWGRTNAFKHQVKTGTLLHRNRNLALRTEWAVSVRALLFVGHCWRVMLKDVMKKQAPSRYRKS